jgi:hypothetical protein
VFARASAIVDTWNHDEVPYTYGLHGTHDLSWRDGRRTEVGAGVLSLPEEGGTPRVSSRA